jgi:hypothetical protein
MFILTYEKPSSNVAGGPFLDIFLDVFYYSFHTSVYYSFTLSGGYVKFFSQRFKTNSINKSSL